MPKYHKVVSKKKSVYIQVKDFGSISLAENKNSLGGTLTIEDAYAIIIIHDNIGFSDTMYARGKGSMYSRTLGFNGEKIELVESTTEEFHKVDEIVADIFRSIEAISSL